MKHHFNGKSVPSIFLLLLFISLSLSSCGQKKETESKSGKIQIEVIAEGLNHPWGMDFLPDGSLLITERSGDLRILNKDANLSEAIPGTPEVFSQGQGGLLDIALHPDFESNRFVYFSFSEPGENNTASTALGRGKLINGEIKNFEVLFSQEPKIDGPNHFGSRIVFHNGKVFLTTGERYQFEPAQDLDNHLGKIIRLNPDGSVPSNNPFINEENAQDEIWTYGHRNIESAAIDPATGNLWIAEMGPSGGDELNLIKKGENYGWPLVSWGDNYDGSKIPDPPTRPEFEDAVVHWTPVISPSGMDFYSGNMFPEWKGKMLIGGLSSKALIIVNVNGDKAQEFDRIEMGTRIRDVQEASDGSIYLLTDEGNGKLLRLSK